MLPTTNGVRSRKFSKWISILGIRGRRVFYIARIKNNEMKKLIIIVMTITLFSCIQEEKTKDLRVIDLASNVGKTSVVNLSDIAESIDYIPLETNDESLLAPPLTYLNFVNGKLYIRQFQTEIKIFNQDGSFIKTFNKQGRGPQEYEFLSDFYIDYSTNNLLVYSTGKLTEYNKEGDFVRRILYQKEEISIFGPNRYFKIEENLNLITFRNYKSKYTSCVTDSLLNVLYFINFSDKDLSTRLNSSKQINFLNPYFYKFRDSVRIFNGYGENILSASNSKGVDTSFILNYGEYHYKNINLNVRNYNNLPFIRRYNKVYESTIYLFIQFHFGSLPHKPRIKLQAGKAGERGETLEEPITASLFNKKTGQFQYVDQPEFNQFGFVDDFEGGPAIWPEYISEDDYMVTIIDAYKFIQHAQTHKVSDKFKKIADGLKETDNPVVILVKLKN